MGGLENGNDRRVTSVTPNLGHRCAGATGAEAADVAGSDAGGARGRHPTNV